MPIPRYGVLKGRPMAGGLQTSRAGQPHYHIALEAGGVRYDIAVNVQSQDGSEVLYEVNHAFDPAHADDLMNLPVGRKLLTHDGGGGPDPLALDFVREHLVGRDQMMLLDIGTPGSHNDLQNEVDDLMNRIIHTPGAMLFAFGSHYPQGDGIHDIHMNQGNPPGSHAEDNGTYQDGALFVHFPGQDRWLAVFLAFQTQVWETDDQGNPLAGGGDRNRPTRRHGGHGQPARRHGGGRSRRKHGHPG